MNLVLGNTFGLLMPIDINFTCFNCNELLVSQVRKARQVWMEIDVDDFVAAGCKWAEVSDNLWVT